MRFLLHVMLLSSLGACKDKSESNVDLDRREEESRSKLQEIDLFPSPRIVGGQNSEPIPSFVSLLRFDYSDSKWKLGCGGTLISNCHVLTAAHCLINNDNNGVQVNTWKSNLDKNKVPAHLSVIRDVIVHEGFDIWDLSNDVGLVRMETCIPAAQKKEFPVMQLAESDTLNTLVSATPLTVIGLGSLWIGGDYPKQLQKVDIPYISKSKCDDYYPYRILDDMFCAGLPEGGKDSCQGDSGGPIFISRPNQQHLQVGVVSWGEGCALPGYPGVYASVGYHREWIAGIVCKDKQVDADTKLCRKPSGILGEACGKDRPCGANLTCRMVRGKGVCRRLKNQEKKSIFNGYGSDRKNNR